MSGLLKSLVWFTALVLLVLVMASSIGTGFQFDKNVTVYVDKFDAATTVSQKLQYLKEFKESLKYVQGTTMRNVFKTHYYTVNTQTALLNGLIARLEETAKLDMKSLEYQQALEELNNHEFGTVGTVKNAYWSAYIRQQGTWFFLRASGLIVLIAFIILLIAGCILHGIIYNYDTEIDQWWRKLIYGKKHARSFR
jgi:hypothetical protein